MYTPVDSMALLIPFHDANMLNFCFAVRGKRGSTGAGGAGSSCFRELPPPPLDPANFPSSQPMSNTSMCTVPGIRQISS